MKQTYLIRCLLATTVLFLVGCGDDITIVAPHRSPALYYLQRSSEFTQVATLLFAQTRDLWGQGIRALYYSALTLARMKDFDGLLPVASSFHEKVWAQTTKKARKFFRDSMRPLRVRYDYDIYIPKDETVEEDLQAIARAGPSAFAALFEDAAASLDRQLSHCTGSPVTCTYCSSEATARCTREVAVAELARIRAQIETLLDSTIPRLMATPNADDRGADAV